MRCEDICFNIYTPFYDDIEFQISEFDKKNQEGLSNPIRRSLAQSLDHINKMIFTRTILPG